MSIVTVVLKFIECFIVSEYGGSKMKELTMQEQFELTGGSAIGTIIIYLLLGAGLYKVIKSSSGKLSIPKLISTEWK
ncbi:MAG: hypothetical protein LUG46_08040 [Erysipelotrichaceae bacterium]|nr:hypothetical protein [Erysipelotrichaceae bacterium]